MACIWNPTEEHVETKMFGNFFQFKPGQFKYMQEHFARFIDMNRKETGLVVLSAKFDRHDEDNYVEGHDKTPEGKEELKEAKKKGIQNLIDFYSQIIRNNQVSLRNELARKDPHTDPVRLSALEASPGEMNAMRLVAKYQKLAGDDSQAQVREVEKLMQQVGPLGK